MKHKIIIPALALCTCILFSACNNSPAENGYQSDMNASASESSAPDDSQPPSKFADYIETDLSKFKKNNGLHNVLESGMGTFCGHTLDYHSIDTFLDELSGNGKTFDEYLEEHGWGSEDFNIVDYVRFMDISKEDYIAGINKHYADIEENKVDFSKIREKMLADAEIIYCGDETKINNYFNNNDGSYRMPGEEEEDISKNFFIIHGALMRYVGVEKYHPYLEYLYGKKYDNVKNFIEYFKIDRGTFEEIMRTAEASDFYDIDDLFE